MVLLCPEGGGFHDSGALSAQCCGLFLIRPWCADGHHFLRSHRGTKRRVRVPAQIPGQWAALWAYHQGVHHRGKALLADSISNAFGLLFPPEYGIIASMDPDGFRFSIRLFPGGSVEHDKTKECIPTTKRRSVFHGLCQ